MTPCLIRVDGVSGVHLLEVNAKDRHVIDSHDLTFVYRMHPFLYISISIFTDICYWLLIIAGSWHALCFSFLDFPSLTRGVLLVGPENDLAEIRGC